MIAAHYSSQCVGSYYLTFLASSVDYSQPSISRQIAKLRDKTVQ